MSDSFIVSQPLPEFPLWKHASQHRIPFSFDLELTARCNCNCRHCYINLPAGDPVARQRELSLGEIDGLADQAVELGALWCLLTGGEPLLHQDFFDLYLRLKKKGLLISLFTNACLITTEHVQFFKRYPPRDIEISVYGITAETYERVTRKPGSYAAFRRGLNLLLEGGIPVRLKAMALRSNIDELPQIASFCRQHTKDFFRFDPLLHLRYDHDPQRNAEIQAERLLPSEIAEIEQADHERATALQKNCAADISIDAHRIRSERLFTCGAGLESFSITYDGYFRLCSSLMNPACTFNLREGSLQEAWFDFVPRVRSMRSTNPEFLQGCSSCSLVNLCIWCPANADLEFGHLDSKGDYYCQVAEARAAAIRDQRAD